VGRKWNCENVKCPPNGCRELTNVNALIATFTASRDAAQQARLEEAQRNVALLGTQLIDIPFPTCRNFIPNKCPWPKYQTPHGHFPKYGLNGKGQPHTGKLWPSRYGCCQECDYGICEFTFGGSDLCPYEDGQEGPCRSLETLH
jgi:hypothetical protein